jgi:hypothetical protein
MLGYQGYAKINGTQFLVNSLSIPHQAVRLDSSSGWGMAPVGATQGIDAPRTYDWSTNDGSMSFDVALGMGAIMKQWIYGRTASRNILFQPCSGSSQAFDCWWSSISFSAAEGSAIGGDVSFMAVYEGSGSYGSQYISNRSGVQTQFSMENLQPLNPSATNIAPVPFWKSTISGPIVASAEPITWSLSFSQDIQKIFKCGATHSPQAPYILGFGPMKVELTTDLYIQPGAAYTVQERATATVSFGDGTTFPLSQMELQTYSQDLRGQNDIAVVSLTYQTYGY